MFENLRSFGLTKYEADVYLTLLRLGSADANLISSTSGVPLGRMYSILNELLEKRVIHSQETRPRKFIAVDPSTSIKYLIEAQRFKLKHQSLALDDMASEIEKELLGIKRSPQNKQFWTAAMGTGAVLDIIIEQLNMVNKEMRITVGYPEFSNYVLSKKPESELTKAMLRALERGVKFRMLIDRDLNNAERSIDENIKSIFRYLGKNLECRITSFSSTLFDIIDDDMVNIKINSPIRKEELFAIVHVRDKKLAKEMKSYFDMVWKDAEPLKMCGKFDSLC
ncbi:MAG: helix-turn-helix domain-containing protein [Candidatus Methanoperedens sp.]|nr:helix-turn-helix domain-containing protein [Candidatus Methanoperedens sp.]